MGLMRKTKLTAGMTAVVAVFGLSVAVAAPAQAAPARSSISNAWDMYQYMVALPSAQLAAQNTPAAQASWGQSFERYNASTVPQWTLGAVYGNSSGNLSAPDMEGDKFADAVPIKPGDPLPSGWLGTVGQKLSIPAFDTGALVKSAFSLPVAAAVTAFQFRSSYANGISSLVGVDANDAVCNGTGNSFLVWLSGQKCAMVNGLPAADQNADVTAGFSMSPACNTHGFCVTGISKVYVDGTNGPNSNFAGFCLNYSGTISSGLDLYAQLNTAENWAAVQTNGGGPGAWYGHGVTGGVVASTTANCTGSAQVVLLDESYPGSPAWPNNAQVKADMGATVPLCFYSGSTPTWNGTSKSCTAAGGGTVTAVNTKSGNPTRTFTCAVAGSDGNTYSATSAPFTENDADYAFPQCPNLPAGVDPANQKITENGGDTPQTLSNVPVSPTYTAFKTAYPDCASKVCYLDLIDKTNGVTCFSEADTCNGWWTDPNQANDYQCQYDQQDVDAKQCAVYAQVFDPAKRTAGDPYADPATGEDPQVQSAPSVDEALNNQPAAPPGIQPDGSVRSCFGNVDWGSFNPLVWIEQPAMCALQWAFVPDPASVAADGQQIATAWGNTMPGQMVQLVQAASVQPSVTGCSIPFNSMWGNGFIIDACSGTLADVATATRIIIDCLFAFESFLALRRIAGGVFEFRTEGATE